MNSSPVWLLHSFSHWYVLLLLVIPILLLAGVWRSRLARLALPLDHSLAVDQKWLRRSIQLAYSLPPLLLAVVIAMWAGPERFSEPKTKRALTNIQFCVDVSGSMSAQFGAGTRYDASMEAINGFLDYRSGDAFGLTFFGNQVLHWVPLTSDATAFRCAPPFMKPGNLPPGFGGTEIGKALLACKDQLLTREEGDRMIILISDGFSADLSGGHDEEVTRIMNDNGISVFAVHIADSEIPDPIIKITTNTGGEVFSPGDTEALSSVFRTIDSMQETKLEKTRSETMDHFEPFCLLGGILLALSVLSSFVLRFTPW